MFMLLYPFYIWKWMQYPTGNRALTEIFTDDGDDGHYVRESLRQFRPGLWSFMSKQLYDLGYEYPEINELRSNLEFPTEFVRV